MTERLLSQNPFRTCDDACGARAPGGQDTPPLQRGRPNEPQDTALAPGRTVPGSGRRGSVPVRRAGARSFADDPGLSRGIVAGRAVPSLRSPEIHPPTLASVPPRSGTPPRGPRAWESGTPRAGRQKREGTGRRGRSGSPIKCPPAARLPSAPRGPWARDRVNLRRPPPAPRLPSAPRGPWARDPVPLRRPPPRSTPALCPTRALGAGPGQPPAPPPAPRLPSAPRGPWARDPVPLRRPPPAPRRPSAPRGPWAWDPVPLRRPPPPLHAGPLPRAGLGRGTRSPSGAPPPLHAGPLPRASLGRGTRSPSGAPPPAPRRPSAPRPSPLRGPGSTCSTWLLSSPPENGRGGGPPFSQARVVPEHIVWGSLVGSARKAHSGRASGGGQGDGSARRRSPAPAGCRPGASVSWRRCAVASRRARGVRRAVAAA